MHTIPIVDVASLVRGDAHVDTTIEELRRACEQHGFFYATGHGLDPELVARLERLGRAFFALPLETKRALEMRRAGRAWRGYFAVGEELTSGAPDRKEGLYFGTHLEADDPRVVAGTALHGGNLYPSEVQHPDLVGFRDAVDAYMAAATGIGHAIAAGLGLALGVDRDYFARHYTRAPLVLFRIFHYPPLGATDEERRAARAWSVGEHTDYGFLTLLHQDASGGLEIRSGGEWIAAPPIEGTLVCNLGDMLDRLTAGRFRSTPHRVRNASSTGRLSFPLFFDPAFDARVVPLPGSSAARDDAQERWDRASVHGFDGTYGDYLVAKVARVFPHLDPEGESDRA